MATVVVDARDDGVNAARAPKSEFPFARWVALGRAVIDMADTKGLALLISLSLMTFIFLSGGYVLYNIVPPSVEWIKKAAAKMETESAATKNAMDAGTEAMRRASEDHGKTAKALEEIKAGIDRIQKQRFIAPMDPETILGPKSELNARAAR